MKTGITFTDNQDLSYIGLRQVGTDADYTETVINWSDNDWGVVDDMAFRFMGIILHITCEENYAIKVTQNLTILWDEHQDTLQL